MRIAPSESDPKVNQGGKGGTGLDSLGVFAGARVGQLVGGWWVAGNLDRTRGGLVDADLAQARNGQIPPECLIRSQDPWLEQKYPALTVFQRLTLI